VARIGTGLDTAGADEKPTRSNGFAGNTAQSIGSQRDISRAVEKEQRRDGARNGRSGL
jgi:hypothetical protein